MPGGSQEAIDLIVGIITDMKLKQEATKIVYRPDYQDYQVLFGNTHHCEILEKSVNDVLQFKSGDAKKQIQFRLNHLFAWEEWEAPVDAPQKEEKIQIEDDF